MKIRLRYRINNQRVVGKRLSLRKIHRACYSDMSRMAWCTGQPRESVNIAGW